MRSDPGILTTYTSTSLRNTFCWGFMVVETPWHLHVSVVNSRVVEVFRSSNHSTVHCSPCLVVTSNTNRALFFGRNRAISVAIRQLTIVRVDGPTSCEPEAEWNGAMTRRSRCKFGHVSTVIRIYVLRSFNHNLETKCSAMLFNLDATVYGCGFRTPSDTYPSMAPIIGSCRIIIAAPVLPVLCKVTESDVACDLISPSKHQNYCGRGQGPPPPQTQPFHLYHPRRS